MKSQTSFCNKSLFKKDILRFWPIWTILLAVLLAGFVMSSLFEIQQIYSRIDYSADENLSAIIRVLRNIMTNSPMMVTISGASIVTAISLWGYLNKTTSAYMLHSLPLRRETHFGSHMLSGFVMISVPVTLTWLMLYIINLHYGAGISAMIGEFYLESMIMVIFYYSLASLVSILCGSGVLSAIVYAVINAAFVVGYWLLKCFNSILSYTGYFNFDFNINNKLVELTTPLLKMNRIISDGHYVAIKHLPELSAADLQTYIEKLSAASGTALGKMALYLIPSAVLIVLSLLLYKKRPLEQTGKLLVFKWSVPIFRFVFVFFGSLIFAGIVYLISGTFLTSVLSYRELLIVVEISVLIGVILFYIICDMILGHTFKIWKKISWWQILIISLVVMLLVFLQKNNYKNSLADSPDDVTRIQVICTSSNVMAQYESRDDINELMKLESRMSDTVAEEMQELTIDEVSYGYMYVLKAQLQDGSVKENYYPISMTYDKELLDELDSFFNEPDRAFETMTLFTAKPNEISSIEIYNYQEIPGLEEIAIIIETEEEKQELQDAIRQDISDGNLTVLSITTGEAAVCETAETDSYPPTLAVYYNIKESEDSFWEYPYTNRFYINENCQNILKILNKKAYEMI